MCGTGLPAPRVTKATFSSHSITMISAMLGAISITLTPKGLSVRDFALRTSSRVHSTVRPPLPMIPAPPALETAAASTASLVHAIPPWITGYFIPKSSVNLVFMIITSQQFYTPIIYYSPRSNRELFLNFTKFVKNVTKMQFLRCKLTLNCSFLSIKFDIRL